MTDNQEDGFQAIGVISCSELLPHQIIEKIIGPSFDQSKIVNRDFGDHSLACYPWFISTKYYEADVHFVAMQDRNLISQEFAESLEAIIIHLDNNDKEHYRKFINWQPFVKQFNPDIKLLVVDTARDDSAIPRQVLLKWCINHEFELIELEPEELSDDEYENDFKESNGTKRIVQALSAHTWPTMEMKDIPQYKPSPKFESLLANEMKNSTSSDVQAKQDSSDGNADSLNLAKLRINSIVEEDKEIFEALNENQELEFEDLFDKFRDLKKKADTLTGDERRLYAEKVTIAFWQSLGGAAEEIEGLDD